MKISGINITMFLIMAAFTTQPLAANKVFSYTAEEMYQMATSFKSIQEGKELSASEVLKASEFKGYIASILDNSNDYDDCARKLPVNIIAGRTAIVITSVPLDRSDIAVLEVLGGLSFACEKL